MSRLLRKKQDKITKNNIRYSLFNSSFHSMSVLDQVQSAEELKVILDPVARENVEFMYYPT